MEESSEGPTKKKQKKTDMKRKSLTGAQKTEICCLKLKGVSQIKLAEQFGIAKATISGIVREKEKCLALDLNSTNAYLKRQRSGKFSLANTVLQTVTGAIIQCKATQLAEVLEVIGFNASDGWLSRFKKQHHIKEYKCLGEGASAPLEDLLRFRSELQEIIKKYKPEDIYNADETALYWHIKPDKTLADGPVTRKKKAKDCVTVLLTCNATGDHKLPPLFIHKYKTSRALKNIDKFTLPVQMRLARHSILLIVDGASTHALEEGFTPTNVNLHFFPLCTTVHLQLCNAGIIWSFKAHYKKIFYKDHIEAFDFYLESSDPPEELTIKDAIDFTAFAWKKVTSSKKQN
ncbi:29921_t:CDS:2 [Gigaspora margarita]|uniref:29921_t:CDS:1 n=1 Tax=Gigaspora margarita TaxID=4874 RepID=A0ABN7WB39_GIGMA|nr:29921_t:CDS:2 [Gigaspora margarita]